MTADRLDDLVGALVRLRRTSNGAVYARAIADARLAVARAVLEDAERRAGAGKPRPAGTVLRLPPGQRSLGDPGPLGRPSGPKRQGSSPPKRRRAQR